MRAWLYYRLSRDEDEELNSLTNQRSIIAGYAEKNGFTIAGESFDDNVSGMHFDRDGIEKICEAVEQNQIDAVIVKDLSRLGRHRTQTAVFIDYLKNVPFPVSWTVKMKKKQKETQDILSYHTQAAGCSDKARAKASGGRQPIEECGRTGL